jgi:hypothetical protein
MAKGPAAGARISASKPAALAALEELAHALAAQPAVAIDDQIAAQEGLLGLALNLEALEQRVVDPRMVLGGAAGRALTALFLSGLFLLFVCEERRLRVLRRTLPKRFKRAAVKYRSRPHLFLRIAPR